jgi:hypothetical protein
MTMDAGRRQQELEARILELEVVTKKRVQELETELKELGAELEALILLVVDKFWEEVLERNPVTIQDAVNLGKRSGFTEAAVSRCLGYFIEKGSISLDPGEGTVSRTRH